MRRLGLRIAMDFCLPLVVILESDSGQLMIKVTHVVSMRLGKEIAYVIRCGR